MSAVILPLPRRRPTLVDVTEWSYQDVVRFAKHNGWDDYIAHYRPGKDRDRVLIQRIFE